MEINIYAAKSQLSQLIRRVTEGEDIVITRNGEPVARLVPMGKPAAARTLGALSGTIRIADDFDAPLPEELMALFEGKA